MNKLLISPEAQDDIEKIRQHIAEELENPLAADNTLIKITRRIRTLVDFPQSGCRLSPVSGFETAYRFLVCGNYLVFYRVEEGSVFVDRILYGKRDYLKLLFGEQPKGDG